MERCRNLLWKMKTEINRKGNKGKQCQIDQKRHQKQERKNRTRK